ncbi:rhamnulokinase [Puteibacter caeruleilacunae]|nr:rhamnulokinase [Puteibacter caeruleilacunae]
MANYFLAFDLGASSGRAMLGILENNKITLKEVHRFENKMTRIDGHDHWDIHRLFNELKTGLKNCIEDHGVQPESIAIDTWGVDYGLLDEDGKLISLPYAYRDSRTDGMMEKVFAKIPSKEVYEQTGIQFMQLNTLFQLFSMVDNNDEDLKKAKDLLFTPDLLSYFFSGEKNTEYCIASTSQMLRPGTQEWQDGLLKGLNIPTDILQKVILPGTVRGTLTQDICEETGSKPIPVVAVGSHDTASAIASVPASSGNWAYLSSGTWSLMGVESDCPIINEKSFKYSFTNEGGINGTTRLLKNITGLWVIQQCRRMWNETEYISFADIVELSKEAAPFQSLIDTDHKLFLNPDNMMDAIDEYCRLTDQPSPTTKAEYARCVFESLALKYKSTLDQIEDLTGTKIDKLHIIGGGANNKLLNQFTANVTGIDVYAGPDEATATGNLLMQARALGYVKDLNHIREIVKDSFDIEKHTPEDKAEWMQAYQKYQGIVEKVTSAAM